MKKFCLVALYDAHKPDEIYIDRVENNDLCVIEDKLRNYEKGTIKLVKLALYAIKYFFPNIKKLFFLQIGLLMIKFLLLLWDITTPSNLCFMASL